MRRTAVITIGSHGFTVGAYHPEFYRTLKMFGGRFVKKKKITKQINGKWVPVWVGDKVFAAGTKDRSELRFHINALKDFKAFMHEQGGYNPARFKEVVLPLSDGKDADIHLMSAEVKPREHQVEWIKYQLERKTSGVTTKINTLQTGKGKLQTLDSRIKIPGGWTTMGDIKLGDVVTAWDGTPSLVTAIYPQGLKQVYRVTFADGRSTEAGAEHLWKVYYINTTVKQRWRVVNTLEMLRLISMPNPRVYVPLSTPEFVPDVELPIDPYVLGYLIGNGSYSELKGNAITVTTADLWVIDELKRLMPEAVKLKHYGRYGYGFSRQTGHTVNTLSASMRSLGMRGKIANSKTIPEIYINSSIKQRYDLLQGLLDSDGYINKPEYGGAVSYCTVSKELAEQVQYLVRSLGDIAAITEKTKFYSYKGEKKQGQLAYQVNIRSKTPSRLFRLPRKRNRCLDNGQYTDILKLRVASIVPTRVTECQCIAIDHPDHLYVTDDFIVTHNTFCALYNMTQLEKTTVIMLMPKYINTWLIAMGEFLELYPEDVVVVQGAPELNQLYDAAKEGVLKAKVVIISLPTYQYCMSEYEDNNGKMEHYHCTPDALWPAIDPGFLIVDEGHESIHALFKLDLYLHVKNKLVLSATLEADDPFINQMYQLIYPFDIRFNGGAYDKYIEAIGVMYGLKSHKLIKCKGFGAMYSHVKFEQSILKSKALLAGYLGFIQTLAEHFFVKKAQPEQKLLIYCGTVEMCLAVAVYLQLEYPQFIIRKYTQEDPKDTLYTSDWIVTTLKSAGTGVDIPGLRTTINTLCIGSRQANDQALGRLRRLKAYPDVTPTYVWTTCAGIDSQVAYHNKKFELFENKTVSVTSMNSRFVL